MRSHPGDIVLQELFRILRGVQERFPGARFIVFGSRARGDDRKDSDIDLYVVFPELTESPWELIVRLSKALHEESDPAFDILISDDRRFNERSGKPWTLEWIVATEGVAV